MSHHRWPLSEPPGTSSRRSGDEAWRSPSVPVEGLSNQPEYEVREAALEVEGDDRPVRIWYRHIYATNAVDVVAITNL